MPGRALWFFFRHALKRDLNNGGQAVRARYRRRVPVVLSRQEARQVLASMAPPYRLVARMIHACGLRLKDCLQLWIKDVDFEQHLLTVRSGKGDKDRRAVLPESLYTEWMKHLQCGLTQDETFSVNWCSNEAWGGARSPYETSYPRLTRSRRRRRRSAGRFG